MPPSFSTTSSFYGFFNMLSMAGISFGEASQFTFALKG